MKTAKQWQKELAGETSTQSIERIQQDALLHAVQLINLDAKAYSPLGLVRKFSGTISEKIIDALP